jgi:hypothetical protein
MPRNTILNNLGRLLHSKAKHPPLLPLDREFLERFDRDVEEHGCAFEFTTSVAAESRG